MTSLLLTGAATSASAALAPATTVIAPGSYGQVMDGQYTDSASSMLLQWDEEVSFVEGVEPYFELTLPGTSMPTRMYGIYLGTNSYGNYEGLEQSVNVILNLGYNYTPGEYIVELPAGIIQNSSGDQKNEAQTFRFVYVDYDHILDNYNPGFKVSPADYYRGYVTYVPGSLDTVNVSWGGYELEATGVGTIVAYTEYYGPRTPLEASVEDGKIVINTSELGVGQWAIEIPAGFAKAIVEENEEEVLYINGAFEITYKIAEPVDLSIYTIDPDAEYNESLYQIRISFSDQAIEFVSEEAKAGITLIDFYENENEIPITVDIAGNYGQHYLQILPTGGITKAGVYRLTVPAQTVTYAGLENQGLTSVFNVLPLTDNYVSTPEPGKVPSAELATISFEYPDATSISYLGGQAQPPRLYIGVGAGQEYRDLVFGEDLTIDGNKIVVTMPTPLEQTQYQVNISKYTFRIYTEEGEYSNTTLYNTYNVWEGLPDATVLDAPEYNATVTPNTEVLLTWDYQPIELTDDFKAYIEYFSYSTYLNEQLMISSEDVELTGLVDPTTGDFVESAGLLLNLKPALTEIIQSTHTYLILKIDEGSVSSNGKINPEFSGDMFNCYAVADVEGVLEASETYEGSYQISWEGATRGSLNNYNGLEILDASGEVVKSLRALYGLYGDMDADSYVWYNPNMILFNPGELEDGKYYVTLSQGFVGLEYDGQTLINGAQTLEFTVGEVAQTTTVTLNFYEAGIDENFLDLISIIYDDYESETELTPAENPYTMEVNPDASIIKFIVPEGYSLAIDCLTELPEDDYSVYIFENTIDLLGVTVANLEFNVTISKLVESEVTFIFMGADDASQAVTVYDISGDTEVPLTITNNELVVNFMGYAGLRFAPEQGVTLSFTAPSGVESGEGTYQIVQNKWVDLWSAVDGKNFVVTIEGYSGINGIAANEDGRYVGYTLTGVKVLDTDNAADINTLAKGIYVINGKKVAVK